MIVFDENMFGKDLFSGLSTVEKDEMLGKLYGILQMRVGQRLGEVLTEEQINEMQSITGEDADDRQFEYLLQTVPSAQQIVAEEVQQLQTEFKDMSDRANKIAKEQSN